MERNKQRRRDRENAKKETGEDALRPELEQVYKLKAVLWYRRDAGLSLRGVTFHNDEFKNGAEIITGAKTGWKDDTLKYSHGLQLVETEMLGVNGKRVKWKLLLNPWDGESDGEDVKAYRMEHKHVPFIFFEAWTAQGGIWGYSLFNPGIANGTLIWTPRVEIIDDAYSKRHNLLMVTVENGCKYRVLRDPVLTPSSKFCPRSQNCGQTT